LAGRSDGYLFQTSEGTPWDASNVLVRKVNKLLDRLEIPKVDLKVLAKIVGSVRTAPSTKRRGARSGQPAYLSHCWPARPPIRMAGRRDPLLGDP
jgi:hypothetical protein